MADTFDSDILLTVDTPVQLDQKLCNIREAQQAVDAKIENQLAEIEALSLKLRQLQEVPQDKQDSDCILESAGKDDSLECAAIPEEQICTSPDETKELCDQIAVSTPLKSQQWAQFFPSEPLQDPNSVLNRNEAQLDEQMSTLQQEICDGEAELNRAQDMIAKLSAQASAIETKTQEKIVKQEAEQATRDENVELKGLLTQLARQKLDCESELSDMQDTHENLLDECDEKMMRIEALLAHSKHLDRSETQKSKALNDTTAELMKLRASHEALKHESQKQGEQIAILHGANERLAKMEQATAEQLLASDNELSEATVQLHQLHSLFQQNSSHVDLLTTLNEKLENELAVTNASLEDSLTTLDGLKSAHEELRCEAENSAAMIDSLSDENTQLTTENNTVSKTLSTLEIELELLRQEHDQLEQDSTALVARINSLIVEKETLAESDQAKSALLAEREAELEELRSAHEILLHESVQQAKRIEFLIDEKQKLTTEKSEAESLSYSNLQAAASDFEQVEAEKLQLEKRVAELVAEKEDLINKGRSSDSRPNTSRRIDDLTRIDGIGPKIEKLLGEHRISNYHKLSSTPVERLESVLGEAGGTFSLHDPTSWPEQAKLAAAGEWEKLFQLQEQLANERRAA